MPQTAVNIPSVPPPPDGFTVIPEPPEGFTMLAPGSSSGMLGSNSATDIQSILDPLNVPREVKARAWDAFNSSRNDAEFRIKFAGIPIPRETKADLWDAKQFTPDQMLKPINAPMAATEAPSMFAPIVNSLRSVGGVAKDVVQGAGKGLAETLGNTIYGVTGIRPAEIPAGSTEATNTAETLGKGVERVGEFVYGGEAGAPLKNILEKATTSTALRTLGKAAIEGATAAGVTAAQEGQTDNITGPALTAATLSIAVPAALKLAGKLGLKIENVLIKPTKADIEDGFKAENVFKYGVGGPIETTLEKTQEKLNNLTTMAKAIRQQNPNAVVNVKQALAQAATELQSQAPTNQGMNQRIIDALHNELQELDILAGNGQIAQNGTAPIDVAHQILQAVGQRGAWTYGFRDAESAASEKVANAFYSQLRQSIEQSVPNGSALQQVNRAMTDLIPIKQAIIRRIPVEMRNQVMHLSDIVALTHDIPLGILNRTLRSGTAANVLVRGSEAADPLGSAVGRLGAAAASGVSGR